MRQKFCNRMEAGKVLAQELKAYSHLKDLIILALPRGGVPVAFAVAVALHAPLDICLVRKLGVPGHEELAMGAISSKGIRILNYDVISALNIDTEIIDQVADRELLELQRRDLAYRGDRPPTNIENKIVILIDDGIATGSTILAAITSLRQQQPRKIIVAVPIAPPSVYKQLELEVDEVVCLHNPPFMSAIGLWYEDFRQVSDEEVRTFLGK